MSVNTSFLELYDKTAQIGFTDYRSSVDSFDVTEHDAGVSMSQLRVMQTGAEFSSFNFQLVKGMKDITETRSSFLLDSDCDGIAFVNNNGQEGLVFAELKSRFSTKHLKKAFQQMMFSLLKIHSMLSLCQDYSINSLSIHFIAACQCFENNDQEDCVYNFLSKAEKEVCKNFEGLFMRKLIEQKNVVIKLGDLTRLWNLPLNSSLTGKTITLSLQFTQKYGDNSTIYQY